LDWWRCPTSVTGSSTWRARSLASAGTGCFSAPRNPFTRPGSPLARRWLGFADADITINAADGTFEARLLVPGPEFSGVPLAGFTGRWVIAEGMILTAITVLA
jgi:4'-phosphopantetheinyl transferase EntD